MGNNLHLYSNEMRNTIPEFQRNYRVKNTNKEKIQYWSPTDGSGREEHRDLCAPLREVPEMTRPLS